MLMRSLQSCGVLVFRLEPEPAVLLLKTNGRWDLPKGGRLKGETEIDCARRELAEETGLRPEDVRVVEGFRHVDIYHPTLRRFNNERVEKRVSVFLAWLERDRPIVLTEHDDFAWVSWPAEHSFDNSTIDGALAEARPLVEQEISENR
jgi:8-oxo-dGTP pyrophosphatase MutT (NUDIX family)